MEPLGGRVAGGAADVLRMGFALRESKLRKCIVLCIYMHVHVHKLMVLYSARKLTSAFSCFKS